MSAILSALSGLLTGVGKFFTWLNNSRLVKAGRHATINKINQRAIEDARAAEGIDRRGGRELGDVLERLREPGGGEESGVGPGDSDGG